MTSYQWQIRIKNNGIAFNVILIDLKTHLSLRGYFNQSSNFISDKECILSINDKNENQICEINIKEKSNQYHTLEIDVTSNNADPKYYQYRKDDIVFLIEDFFKISTNHYFYLETLSKHEIEPVNNRERGLHPKQIFDRLKSNPVSIHTKTPEKIYHSGDYDNTLFYFGLKEEFLDIINFWISFKTWAFMNDEFEFDNLNVLTELNYVNQNIGKCIPLSNDSDTIKGIISLIEKSDSLDNNLLNFKKAYDMGTEWDYQIILFDNTENYFIYNWWTTQ